MFRLLPSVVDRIGCELRGGPVGRWVLASLDEEPWQGSADLGGNGACWECGTPLSRNRQCGTLGRVGRRRLPRATGAVFVLAAQAVDVRGLIKASGQRPARVKEKPCLVTR
jgi:hypothetical protein